MYLVKNTNTIIVVYKLDKLKNTKTPKENFYLGVFLMSVWVICL